MGNRVWVDSSSIPVLYQDPSQGTSLRLTGTTPIDLDDIAFDLKFYLAAGYRVDQPLTRGATP